MSRQELINKVHSGLIFPQTLSKVQSCLETLLLRGLLEEIKLTHENAGEDVEMNSDDFLIIKFVN